MPNRSLRRKRVNHSVRHLVLRKAACARSPCARFPFARRSLSPGAAAATYPVAHILGAARALRAAGTYRSTRCCPFSVAGFESHKVPLSFPLRGHLSSSPPYGVCNASEMDEEEEEEEVAETGSILRGFNDAVSGFPDPGVEWADPGVDAYSAASLRASPYAVPGLRASGFMGSQVILPLAHTLEHEEFLEVIRLEGHGFSHDEVLLSRDMYLLQLCSGVDENAAGACAQLVFAPIDESFADDAPLLPSGFRVIPLDAKTDVPSATRTLDLASALEVGSGGASRALSDASGTCNMRSVLTIAFQFSFENHLRESVAAMARQYVRAVMASVQRVAMAIAPSRLGSQIEMKHPPGSPEALTLASWIGRSYRVHTGGEIHWSDTEDVDSPLKLLWKHSDAILCCSLKAAPMFTFANKAGLDILETTLINLQDISLETILDDEGRKALCSEFPKIMQQGFAYLPGGVCKSSMGRQASYEQAVAWKVLGDDDTPHCLAFMLVNWTFM